MNGINEEKVLEILAKEAKSMSESENIEIEKRLLEVPEDLDSATLEMIKQMDRERAKKEKQVKWKRYSRVAAIALICIISINVIGISTSEAYRSKLFNLFYNEGSVTLLSQSEQEMLQGWEDFWYPTYLPEGFYLFGVSDEVVKVMAFASDSNEGMIHISILPENRPVHYDTDNSTQENVRINEFDGIMFCSESYNYVMVTWLTDDSVIEISMSNSQDKELIMKIAKGMEYVGDL